VDIVCSRLWPLGCFACEWSSESIGGGSLPARIRIPLRAKLSLGVPTDQLNLSRVVLAMIEMDEMESAIARAGQAAEELQRRVASVAKKTQNIKQTAVVFLAKSMLLDEMDRMATAMKGAT
jgi:Trm5-related predicted tRNA methylase